VPFIDVTISEGRAPELVRALIHELHEAACRSLGASPDAVRVVIREVPLTHWAAADVTLAERHG
jgi:4-oxalocrotonate tautomerase